MSNQWEVVGKKKEKGSNKLVPEKVTKDTKKKINNGVKLEEVLPMSKVKNLYATGKGNKENQKPQEKVKVQDNNTKKVQKKDENKPPTPKIKPPKSIEGALNIIKVEDFNDVFEKNRAMFPEAPIVWLKEMAQFLNTRIPLEIQDPIFSNKPSNYPLSVMPTPIRNVIDKAVKAAGSDNSAVFYDICLTTMATDMNKDLSAIGHKLFIQHLALNDPKIATNNIAKYNVLRNSYQNKQAIGSSILWALGQAGFKDFSVGIKVFQEIMLPLLEMKSYSRFVITYLINLVTIQKDSAIISRDQYLLLTDITYMTKKNVPQDINKELLNIAPKLNALLFAKGNEKYFSYIEPFLKKITQSTTNKQYQTQLCQAVVNFIEKDSTCLGTWGKVYAKNIAASAILLNYIEDNWKVVSKKINIKVFTELLKTYDVVNEELNLKKRKDDGLLDCMRIIKNLNNKMAKQTKSSGFPCKTFLFLIISITSAFIYYDVNKNGSWTNSTTSRTLNETGVYNYTDKAMSHAREASIWLHDNIEGQFPGVTQATIKYTEPYIELCINLGKVASNIVCDVKKAAVAKIPMIMEKIELYAPGLIEKTQSFAQNAWTVTCVYIHNGVEFVRTEVLTGKLEPENIQKVLSDAVNQVHHKAFECYHWVYEKIQSAIK